MAIPSQMLVNPLVFTLLNRSGGKNRQSMDNMDISIYQDFFHDGFLLAIEYEGEKIVLSMKSAEVALVNYLAILLYLLMIELRENSISAM